MEPTRVLLVSGEAAASLMRVVTGMEEGRKEEERKTVK